MRKIVIFLLAVFTMANALSVGERLPNVVLDKANGGTSIGQAWHSTDLKGKVHLILYMDPDERKESQSLLDALNALDVDAKAYSTVAIVNLAATWMPDAILEGLLSKKQKELKNTSFVFDKEKVLVKKWQMKDDASNVLVVDKNGKILYQRAGKLSDSEINKIIDIIRQNI
jgi:YtfJ family uncharacterized protein